MGEFCFGEFMQTMQPNFRHEEMVKNAAWAQLLALAFNTLVDLRKYIPKEGAIRKVLMLTQDLVDPGFVAITVERVESFASANLTTFRAHALKLFNVFISHAVGEKLRIHPGCFVSDGLESSWRPPLRWNDANLQTRARQLDLSCSPQSGSVPPKPVNTYSYMVEVGNILGSG